MEFELVPKETLENGVAQKPNNPNNEELPKYIGPSHRKGRRRVLVDRREMIRFETKADRRSGDDRRFELQLWDRRDT